MIDIFTIIKNNMNDLTKLTIKQLLSLHASGSVRLSYKIYHPEAADMTFEDVKAELQRRLTEADILRSLAEFVSKDGEQGILLDILQQFIEQATLSENEWTQDLIVSAREALAEARAAGLMEESR